MKNLDDLSEDATLRRKAEELLKTKAEDSRRQYSEAELLKLVHELDVHQIELEMQNEELVLAKSVAREAAEKYTELFDFAPTGYFTISREGLIREVNLTGSIMLGTDRSRIIDKPLRIFVSEDSRAAYSQFLEKLLVSGMQESCELMIASENDAPMYVFVTGIASENGDQCMITMADITKRKKAEEELVAAKEKAMESDRLKTAFLANMSHEIRTPMNGILGFTWMLKQPMLTSEQQQEYISIIEKSGVRMLHIINDILSIAKVEAGQVELAFSETNLNAHIDYIRTFFEPEIERKGLRMIVKKGQPTGDFLVMTDGEKFFSILTNIVKNAIKFTNEGSITIGYEMKGESIEIFVKDTGTGLRQDQKEIIFERFRQGSELLTRNNEGSGLGLAIAKAYVELLGGEIRVESEIGRAS
ncbi:MAG: histidine kinase dimerization/phospho-acceptor domain-containing protein, partial [Bacteroidota bacterium]